MMMVAFSERREGTREWRAEFPMEREPEHCPTHFPAPYYSGIFISKTALRPKAACAISRIHCARKWCKRRSSWKEFLENMSGLDVFKRHFFINVIFIVRR